MISMGRELVAFRTGERVTLDYLNAYAKPENRVDVNKPFRPYKNDEGTGEREDTRSGMSVLWYKVIKGGNNGILPGRCMAVTRMRFITGGCGRSAGLKAATGISF